MSLLEVNGLKLRFYSLDGPVEPLNGINFQLEKGEVLGLVGETGCGKSITAKSVIKLISYSGGEIIDGSIIFDNEDLLSKSEKEMQKIRGVKISLISQDPMTSLDPVYRVGDQIIEAIQVHKKLRYNQAKKEAVELIRLMGIPLPEKVFYQYPHELSGGMKQRIIIAIALSCDPALVIADEPTTALDVTIQAQIIDLFSKLIEHVQSAFLLITHDLGVVAQMCDSVAIMYAGNIVEKGPVKKIFHSPKHPYTEGLLQCIPKMDRKQKKLTAIPGSVPHPRNFPTGCRFYPRCQHAMKKCLSQQPGLIEIDDERFVACFRYFKNSDGEQE
jgi:oligopeptide/dipeptide ABC transporter ATP-binding protein